MAIRGQLRRYERLSEAKMCTAFMSLVAFATLWNSMHWLESAEHGLMPRVYWLSESSCGRRIRQRFGLCAGWHKMEMHECMSKANIEIHYSHLLRVLGMLGRHTSLTRC